MKKIILWTLLLVVILGAITGCSDQSVPRVNQDNELFESFVPVKSAEIGERFQIDTKNAFTIREISVEKNDKGQDVLLVTYDWENLSNKANEYTHCFTMVAKQAGATLKGDLTLVADKGKLVREVKAGETNNDMQQGFILENTESPVTFEFTSKQLFLFVDGFPVNAYPIRVVAELP